VEGFALAIAENLLAVLKNEAEVSLYSLKYVNTHSYFSSAYNSLTFFPHYLINVSSLLSFSVFPLRSFASVSDF
jgi:hypothetical protein